MLSSNIFRCSTVRETSISKPFCTFMKTESCALQYCLYMTDQKIWFVYGSFRNRRTPIEAVEDSKAAEDSETRYI